MEACGRQSIRNTLLVGIIYVSRCFLLLGGSHSSLFSNAANSQYEKLMESERWGFCQQPKREQYEPNKPPIENTGAKRGPSYSNIRCSFHISSLNPIKSNPYLVVSSYLYLLFTL